MSPDEIVRRLARIEGVEVVHMRIAVKVRGEEFVVYVSPALPGGFRVMKDEFFGGEERGNFRTEMDLAQKLALQNYLTTEFYDALRKELP